jgi:hypothetical protein
MNYLPRMPLNCDPPDLCLLSSWDYRCEHRARLGSFPSHRAPGHSSCSEWGSRPPSVSKQSSPIPVWSEMITLPSVLRYGVCEVSLVTAHSTRGGGDTDLSGGQKSLWKVRSALPG